MQLISRIKTKSVYAFYLFSLFALCSCNKDGYDIIELEINNIIHNYNDSTFVSYGLIEELDFNHFIICDIKNRWIGIVNKEYKNLQIIGKQGRGAEEYPNLVSKIFTDSNEVFMIGSHGVLYSLFIQQDTIERSVKSLDILKQRGVLSSITIIGNNIYCMANPVDKSLFIQYHLMDGEIANIGKKPIANRNKSKNKNDYVKRGKILTHYKENYLVTVPKYGKKPYIQFFKLPDGENTSTIKIPLCDDIIKLLKIAPQAPTFEDIIIHENRIYLALNGVGILTGEINARMDNIINWKYLKYPKEIIDNVILSNFIVSNNKIILFTHGEIKEYNSPL